MKITLTFSSRKKKAPIILDAFHHPSQSGKREELIIPQLGKCERGEGGGAKKKSRWKCPVSGTDCTQYKMGGNLVELKCRKQAFSCVKKIKKKFKIRTMCRGLYWKTHLQIIRNIRKGQIS